MLLKACYDSVCYERMCYEMACYERMFYKKVCYKRVCHGTYGMNGKRCVCVWGGGGYDRVSWHLPYQRRVVAIRCRIRPYQIGRIPSRFTVKKDGGNGVIMVRHL